MDSKSCVSKETLEKHRFINVNHVDWWDYVYDEFKEYMKEQGVHVERMMFSGFWSQGDGACFEGFNSDGSDTERFLNFNFKPEEYPMIRMVVANGGRVRLTCKQSGHYYHENCTSFSLDVDYPSNVLDTPTYIHELIVEGFDRAMEIEVDDFEKASIEIFKANMRRLYTHLEREYDHLVSDEAVSETVIANDLTDEGE